LNEEQQAAADLNCSISSRTIYQSVIGFGIEVTHAKSGKNITTDLYPISYESFYDDKVRVSAGGAKMTHFLPFAINADNWKKVQQKTQESISLIMTDYPNKFKPSLVLDVIGEMWKTKAVEMMKGEEHASEKILVGFCAFHHLLLSFAQSYPELVKICTDKVAYFISSPNNRNKQNCPDFGRFLPLFLLSDIKWEDEKHAGRICVSELLTRNAMWILKQERDLIDPDLDNNRVTRSWAPSQVGLKLTCFQIRYILEVGRPENETSLQQNWERLNKLMGRPSARMVQDFQATVKKVQAITDYPTWFKAMGLGSPPESEILAMLQDAMRNSESQGYHSASGGGGGRGGGRGGRGRR